MPGHVKSELVWWGSQRLSVTWLHCLLPPDNRPWTVPALPGAHQVSHFCQIKSGQLFPSATKLLCFVINQYSRNILKLHIIQVPSEANYLIQARWVTGVKVVNLLPFLLYFLLPVLNLTKIQDERGDLCPYWTSGSPDGQCLLVRKTTRRIPNSSLYQKITRKRKVLLTIRW